MSDFAAGTTGRLERVVIVANPTTNVPTSLVASYHVLLPSGHRLDRPDLTYVMAAGDIAALTTLFSNVSAMAISLSLADLTVGAVVQPIRIEFPVEITGVPRESFRIVYRIKLASGAVTGNLVHSQTPQPSDYTALATVISNVLAAIRTADGVL